MTRKRHQTYGERNIGQVGRKDHRLPSITMTSTTTEIRYGATPVLSRAGGVPVPLPRSSNGIAQVTRAPSSKGHPRSRRVMVKQRRLNTVRAPGTQTPTQPKQTQQHKQHNNLNILQINIDGISNKKIILAHLFSQKNIHVALVQESLHQNADPHISNYTHTSCDHDRHNCQGIITYIRN